MRQKSLFHSSITKLLYIEFVLFLSCILSCKKPLINLAKLASNEQWNCLLIVLDAARYDHFSFAGYFRKTTPHIDNISKQGVYFTNAFSQHSCTDTSIPSMFAGLYPTNIDASKQIWLVDLFNKLDFNTVIFSENPGVQKSFTFANGFQNYMEDYPFEKIISAEYNINKTIRSELLYQVKNWIINSKKRFFCYLHLLLPHNPYFPPEPFNNKFLPNIYDKSLKPTTENLVKIANNEIAISPLQREYIISQYDANLFYADYIVGYLLDELKKQKVLSRTVVIITSDHGEAFGEHKLWLHCHSCYNEMLRIPLIFYFPQSAKIKDIKLNFRVGLIDIMPTLHELFGFNAKSNYDGINLLPFFSGLKKPKERVIIGESTTQISAMLGSFKLIRTFRSFQNFKLPQPDTEQLFDLESDYNENSDVSALYPEVTLLLKKLIDMYNEKKPNSNSIKEKLKNIDKITLERLRSLGYIR